MKRNTFKQKIKHVRLREDEAKPVKRKHWSEERINAHTKSMWAPSRNLTLVWARIREHGWRLKYIACGLRGHKGTKKLKQVALSE